MVVVVLHRGEFLAVLIVGAVEHSNDVIRVASGYKHDAFNVLQPVVPSHGLSGELVHLVNRLTVVHKVSTQLAQVAVSPEVVLGVGGGKEGCSRAR